jgi:hypothetical protein
MNGFGGGGYRSFENCRNAGDMVRTGCDIIVEMWKKAEHSTAFPFLKKIQIDRLVQLAACGPHPARYHL